MLKNSILNLLSSPRHPFPGSFFVHWAKKDNLLLLTCQKLLQNDENEKSYFAFDSLTKIVKSYTIKKQPK